PRFFDRLGVPGLTEVGSQYPPFVVAAAKLLASRPLAEWKAYLRVSVVGSYASVLGPKVRALSFDLYERRMQGKTEARPWRIQVLAIMNRTVGDPLGQLYIERHVPRALVELVRETTQNVKDTFRKRLAANTWMGESTRREALAK